MAITLDGTNGVTTPDLTVDTNTLTVDTTNNRVGVGTTSPADHLAVVTSGANAHSSVDRSDGATGRTVLIHSTSGGQLQTTGSAPLIFGTADTERGRFLPGGGLTFIGDTAAVNALDDYEEGTWTPTYDTGFPSGSPEEVVQGAKYVKVGRLVHCILRLQARNDGTSMQLGGLPFVPNCDGCFGTVGHDSHTTRKERIFSGSSWIAWVYSGTSGSLVNHYFTITYTTDS